MLKCDLKALKASFNQAAMTYDHYSFLQKHVGFQLSSRLDFLKAKPKTILEIGCGTGFCTQLLRKKFPDAKIVAIDFAEKMLEIAKKNTQDNGIEYICADAHALPFENFSFDLIFSNLTMQWLSQLDKVFLNWLGVIHPEGSLIFSTFGPETLKELRLSWREVDEYTHVNAFFDILTVGEKLMQSHWEHPVLDYDNIILEYPDLKKIFIDLKKIGAHNVTEDRRRSMMPKQKWQAFIKNYNDHFFNEGKYQITYQILYGQAFAPAVLKQVMYAKQFNKIDISIREAS